MTAPTPLASPQELHALPDDTLVESLSTCAWPARYAGRRWRKSGSTLHPQSPDPITGDTNPAALVFFKDPLPVTVVTEGA